MRSALIAEAVTNVVVGGRVRLDPAAQGLLLGAAVPAVCEQVVRVFGGHEPKCATGQGQHGTCLP